MPKRRTYATEKDYQQKRKADFTAVMNRYKASPCADCGGRFDLVSMDFDHRDPSKKEFCVSHMRKGFISMRRFVEEIEKCDVVCANCHRVRTKKQHEKGVFFIGFKKANDKQLTFL